MQCIGQTSDWPDTLFATAGGMADSMTATGTQPVPAHGTSTHSPLCEEDTVEWHPLIPFLPHDAKVLMLGSFPPQRKRWCMDFYYPNFINDHWRIHGLVFHGDASHFISTTGRSFRLHAIVEHLMAHGIALFDTAIAVRRLAGNASDDNLEVAVPTDLHALAAHLPQLRAIVTTGTLATRTAMTTLLAEGHKPPRVGESMPTALGDVELHRLPSSSRAYPLALPRKAEAYAAMFCRYL